MAQAAKLAEVNLGTFEFSKETPNTHRFEQEREDARPLLQYVSKDLVEALGNPTAIEVTVRAAS